MQQADHKTIIKLLPLLLATIIWGMGFVATRWTLVDYSPIWSNSLRFFFAGIISIPILIYRRSLWFYRGPFICAFFLLIGLQLQTIGLAHTTLAKSGFITVFYAIFTPLLTTIFYKARYTKGYWGLVFLALIGIAFLCELDLHNFNYGDVLTLVSALFLSLHILAVDRFVDEFPPFLFNILQCFYVGLMGTIFALAVEGLPMIEPLLIGSNLLRPSALTGFILLSIFSSHLAFGLQMVTQKSVPAHLVSLCFLLESVFAAIFGNFFFGEKLSILAMSGCLLVIISVALLPFTEDR